MYGMERGSCNLTCCLKVEVILLSTSCRAKLGLRACLFRNATHLHTFTLQFALIHTQSHSQTLRCTQSRSHLSLSPPLAPFWVVHSDT